MIGVGWSEIGVSICWKKRWMKEMRHTFQVYVMIVEDRLASKRRPNLLRMGILLITESLSAEFVVECVLRWKACLDEPVP